MQLVHYPTSLSRGTSDLKGGMTQLTPRWARSGASILAPTKLSTGQQSGATGNEHLSLDTPGSGQ
jgi:hypothetical protein